MLIDIIVIIILILAAVKGFRNGFILALFSFLAFIIGLAAAIKLSAVAAAYIGSSVNVSQRWLPVIAFVVVFLIVVLLVRLGAKLLEGVVNIAMLGWLNRLGGVVFYALLYIFVFSLILFYADETGLIKPETAEASTTFAYIRPLGPKVMEGLGTIIPLFKNMFLELEAFFEGVAQNKTP
jgi:membrane protein required for colicin V production